MKKWAPTSGPYALFQQLGGTNHDIISVATGLEATEIWYQATNS